MNKENELRLIAKLSNRYCRTNTFDTYKIKKFNRKSSGKNYYNIHSNKNFACFKTTFVIRKFIKQKIPEEEENLTPVYSS